MCCVQLHMYKNSNHQVVLPVDALGETVKADLCRTYGMVAAACPLHTSSATRGQGVLSTKDLFKVMLSNIRYMCGRAGLHATAYCSGA